MTSYIGTSRSPNSSKVFEWDAANPKSYSPNRHPYSTDIYSWVTGGNAMTLSRDTATVSPVGSKPLKIVTTGTSGYTGSYSSLAYTIAPAAVGETWTVSAWVKASAPVQASFYIFGANSAGTYIETSQTYFNVTTQWQRFSATVTFSNASTVGIQTRFDCYVNATTLWVDGWQVERASSMTPFNPANYNGQWIDLTGNGNHATPYNQPSFSAANGGVVEFNGTNSHFRAAGPVFTTGSYTILGAARYSGATRGRIITALTNNWLLGHWSGSTENYYAAGWVSSTTSGPNDTNWRIYAATGNSYTGGLDYRLYKNGAPVSVPTPAGGTAGPNGMAIGAQNGTGEFSTGQCAYVAGYNRVLTASEIYDEYLSLRGRFGL